MVLNIQAIRGMNDILPSQSCYWQYIERRLKKLFDSYGYQEIRLPLLEKTELFQRGIGEATDIVEKEMYTFCDRNNEQLTLRPEGTAGCVRAAIEHGLLYHQQQKLWYGGAMFRYERPQKGRYRQFHQIGVETYGYSGPLVEAELILMMARLWRQLGLSQHIHLQVNSLGTSETRARYRDAFVAFCHQYHDQLDEDSHRRLITNPLRILDSKNPTVQSLLQNAPNIIEYLDDHSRQHFERLCNLLQQANIPLTMNPRLVRGLDYYTGTVFEWVTESLGAQGAICAGGRYDGLVAQLGGPDTPAVGFAIGMERLIALYELTYPQLLQHPLINIYFIAVGEVAERVALRITEKLHTVFPKINIMMNLSGGNFKAQFKRADKSGADYALILGEDEIKNNQITCKNLRKNIPQQTFSNNSLIDYLRSIYGDGIYDGTTTD